jgi:hypothetical protein
MSRLPLAGGATALLALLSFAVGAGASADEPLPAMEGSLTPVSQVYNATRSVVLGDRRDARRAYVLPPATGWVVPRELETTSNATLCADMLALRETSRRLSAEIGQRQLGANPYETELEGYRTLVAAALGEVARSAAYAELLLLADARESDAWELEDEIAALEEVPCTAAVRSIAPHYLLPCDDPRRQARLGELYAELHETLLQVAELRDEAREMRIRHVAAREQARQILAHVEHLEAAADTHAATLQALHDQTHDLYRHYATLWGGTLEVRFDAGWDESLITLAADNADLTFEPVRTRGADIHAALVSGVGADSYLASLPAVLASRLVGEPGTDDSVLTRPEYPQQLSMELDLSLAGACPVLGTGDFDVETVEGLPIFGLTIVYEHELTFPYAVAVAYNGYQLLGAIRRGSSGSLATAADVLELARPLVRITWRSTAPSDAAERRRIEDQLVSEAIDRVLAAAGTVAHDWNGTDAWRPRLTPGVASFPRPRITERGKLTSMTGGSAHDDFLAASGVAPDEPYPLLSPAPRQPPRGAAGELPLARAPLLAPAPWLTPEQARLARSATQIYEREVMPTCGFDQLRCDGARWTSRPLSEARLRAVLDREFAHERAPTYRSWQPAMAVFDTLGPPPAPPSYTGRFTAQSGCTVAWQQFTCTAHVSYETDSTRACVYEGSTLLGCDPSSLSLSLTPGTHRLTLRSGRSALAKQLATTDLSIAAAPRPEPEPECTINRDCADGVFCNGVELCRSGRCVAGTRTCAPGVLCQESTRTCGRPPIPCRETPGAPRCPIR